MTTYTLPITTIIYYPSVTYYDLNVSGYTYMYSVNEFIFNDCLVTPPPQINY